MKKDIEEKGEKSANLLEQWTVLKDEGSLRSWEKESDDCLRQTSFWKRRNVKNMRFTIHEASLKARRGTERVAKGSGGRMRVEKSGTEAARYNFVGELRNCVSQGAHEEVIFTVKTY